MCCTDLKYVWHNHDEIRFVPQNAGCWTHQLCWDPHSKHLAYIWCLLLSELPTTCLIYTAGVFWLDAHTNHYVCYNTWIYCYHIGLIFWFSGAQCMLILVIRPEDNFLNFFLLIVGNVSRNCIIISLFYVMSWQTNSFKGTLQPRSETIYKWHQLNSVDFGLESADF